MNALLTEIEKEIASLENLMWFTPYLGKRYALLIELRDHIRLGLSEEEAATGDCKDQVLRNIR